MSWCFFPSNSHRNSCWSNSVVFKSTKWGSSCHKLEHVLQKCVSAVQNPLEEGMQAKYEKRCLKKFDETNDFDNKCWFIWFGYMLVGLVSFCWMVSSVNFVFKIISLVFSFSCVNRLIYRKCLYFRMLQRMQIYPQCARPWVEVCTF